MRALSLIYEGLEELSQDMDSTIQQELVDSISDEQRNHWLPGSSGWNVLEALKQYVLDNTDYTKVINNG